MRKIIRSTLGRVIDLIAAAVGLGLLVLAILAQHRTIQESESMRLALYSTATPAPGGAGRSVLVFQLRDCVDNSGWVDLARSDTVEALAIGTDEELLAISRAWGSLVGDKPLRSVSPKQARHLSSWLGVRRTPVLVRIGSAGNLRSITAIAAN